MKVQCVHNDTGLCKTCWDYEQEIARLTKETEDLTSSLEGMGNCRNHALKDNYALKQEIKRLAKEKQQVEFVLREEIKETNFLKERLTKETEGKDEEKKK